MAIYIALLRGINVGGHNKIKMADLKQLLESLGLERVQTYIQSGNVLFESEEIEDTLQTKIEDEIKRVFGFTVTVMLRTYMEFKHIIENCPFTFESLSEGESIHVSFLTEAPSHEAIDNLPDVTFEIDEYDINGREIYFLFHQSILDSKLPNKLSKLGTATMRNWKTVVKLAAMAKAME